MLSYFYYGDWEGFTCGRSGETCSKRSARNSEPCEFTHLGERQSRFREFSAVGTGVAPRNANFTCGLRASVYASHKKNTRKGASLFWSFTAIFRFAELLRCGTLCLMAVQSTTFAHPKCRGAWVGFTSGRSGETCSKRSARNSEPCEFTHLGERQSRFREFSAVGTGVAPRNATSSFGLRSSVYATHYNSVEVLCTKTDGYGQNKSPPQMQALERTFCFGRSGET